MTIKTKTEPIENSHAHYFATSINTASGEMLVFQAYRWSGRSGCVRVCVKKPLKEDAMWWVADRILEIRLVSQEAVTRATTE